jgi:hypothetical protein
MRLRSGISTSRAVRHHSSLYDYTLSRGNCWSNSAPAALHTFHNRGSQKKSRLRRSIRCRIGYPNGMLRLIGTGTVLQTAKLAQQLNSLRAKGAIDNDSPSTIEPLAFGRAGGVGGGSPPLLCRNSGEGEKFGGLFLIT